MFLLAGGLLAVQGCSDAGQPPTGNGDGQPVMLSVSDQTGTEGYVALFRVTLSRAATGDVVFEYATRDFTATGVVDYSPVTLRRDTIPVGDSLIVIPVFTANTDGLKERAETFELVLSNLSGAEFADSVGVGTILDIDGARFSSDIKPVLVARCAISLCHSPSNPANAAGGMYLGGVGYDTVLSATGVSTGGKVIIPDSADASALYVRTLSTTPFAIRMPQGGPYLPDSTIAKIGEWINYGAQNN